MKLSKAIETFYDQNQDEIESAWSEHLSYAELGSGFDRIQVTDEMFWEFVENLHDSQQLPKPGKA